MNVLKKPIFLAGKIQSWIHTKNLGSRVAGILLKRVSLTLIAERRWGNHLRFE